MPMKRVRYNCVSRACKTSEFKNAFKAPIRRLKAFFVTGGGHECRQRQEAKACRESWREWDCTASQLMLAQPCPGVL